MKNFFLIVFFLNITSYLTHAKEINIIESSNSPLSKMVSSHMKCLVDTYFEQVSVDEMQLVANALSASYQYAQADIKYDKILSKILMTLWKLKTKNNSSEELTKKLSHLIKKLNRSFMQKQETENVWQAIIQYFDLHQQNNAVKIFEAIAFERMKIVEEYLHNNNGLLVNSCSQTHENNHKLAIRINSIANMFKAFEEMPFEGQEHERAFALLNSAYSLVLALEAEQPKLIEAINPIMQHIEDVSLMNMVLDSLYYAQFSTVLKNNFDNEPVIFFDQVGILPELQKTVPLPTVCYCNNDLVS